MAMQPELSATMAACLAAAYEHGGRLVHFVGGYWSWPDCPRDHNGVPVEHFGTSTVQGLIRRERLAYSQWRDGRHQRFPVEATVTPDQSEATPR